jgi:hypothetical protein
MRARWTTIIALAAMVALVAAPAFAQHETETFADIDTEVDSSETEVDSADRALIHTYDPDAMQLLWAIAIDGAEDQCEVDEEATYTYEIGDEDEVIVYDEDDAELEDCSFNATDVTGPNGQVNHGTVVSAFVKALKEQGITGGIGCYVKLIAQSDYGKDDQQVNVPDVEDEETVEETEETEEPTEVQFTVSETTCGKPDHAGPPEDKGKPEGKGKPEWAGQGKDHPDHPANGKGRP